MCASAALVFKPMDTVPYLNVVLGVTPVPLGIQVAQAKTVQLPKMNLGHWAADFPSHEIGPCDGDREIKRRANCWFGHSLFVCISLKITWQQDQHCFFEKTDRGRKPRSLGHQESKRSVFTSSFKHYTNSWAFFSSHFLLIYHFSITSRLRAKENLLECHFINRKFKKLHRGWRWGQG